MHLRFSRRRFLASSTLGAVSALPFVKLLTRNAYAAPNAKFLVALYHPFGVVHADWFPATAGRTFEFKKASAPLAAIKNDIIIFSKIDNAMGEKNECANGLDQHQAGVSSTWAGATMRGGKAAGPGTATIDSQVAKHLVPDKHHDQVVINLGVRSTEHGDAWIRWPFRKTDGAHVESQDDPAKAFRTLFGDGGSKVPAAAGTPPDKPFTGVKDALKDDLLSFERSLAGPERARFQQYMEAFSAFEKNMETELAPKNLCKELPSGAAFTGPAIRSDNIWPIAKLQVELAVLALSCGARRVATLHLTDGFRNYLVPAGPNPDTAVCNGHDLSHHTGVKGDPTRLRTNLNFKQASLFVELVQGLKGATNPLTGSGSLFDDTVVLWGSCISGAGGGGHSKLRVPFTLAAGRNAGFVTGRHLDANFGTVSMLLRGVCNAFGMPDKPFGDVEFSPAPLGGLKEDVAVAGTYPRKVTEYLRLTGRCQGHAT